MRILLVADGRSPIARRWLELLASCGYEVHLASSFPCGPLEAAASLHVLPVAFGRFAGSGATMGVGSASRSSLRPVIARFRSLFLKGRYVFGALSVQAYGSSFRRLAREIQPDLVHALRIPFEGMLASAAPRGVPLVVSIWGNDLTLHANGSERMRALSMRCLRRADGLMADARRDVRLGKLWGFAPDAPTLVVPGSGGLDLEGMRRPDQEGGGRFGDLPTDTPLVINPRGFRPGSVRNDTFFQAVPRVLQVFPRAVFLCPAMAGQAEAIQQVDALKIAGRVRLLEPLPQVELWGLFRRAQVMVSPGAHDGTPNSLLEAMACGCFPVAGDIESIREWITPGLNGLLVDPGDPGALGEAILTGLMRPDLRARAAEHNARILLQRAERGQVRQQVMAFYEGMRERAIRDEGTGDQEETRVENRE